MRRCKVGDKICEAKRVYFIVAEGKPCIDGIRVSEPVGYPPLRRFAECEAKLRNIMSNNLDLVFPSIILTDGEIIELKKVLTSPYLRKYLQMLATEDSKELLALSSLDLSDKELANRHILVSGKLAVLTTLLSICKE